MYSNVTKLPILDGYEKAHTFFNKTALPKWRKESNRWDSNTRPLGSPRQRHYRIACNDDGLSYSLWLYDLEVARFHKPVDGFEYRQYRGYPSQTTTAFFWEVLRFSYRVHDLNGNWVYCPAAHNVLEGSQFSTELYVRSSDGYVDTKRSRHVDVFKRVTGDEDKVKRKQFRQSIEPYIKMVVITSPSWNDDVVKVSYWSHLVSTESVGGVSRNLFKSAVSESDFDSVYLSERFVAESKKVYHNMVAARAYVNDKPNSKTNGGEYRITNSMLENPVTAKQFEKVLRGAVSGAASNFISPTKRLSYGQFPALGDIVFSNIHTF